MSVPRRTIAFEYIFLVAKCDIINKQTAAILHPSRIKNKTSQILQIERSIEYPGTIMYFALGFPINL